MEVKVLVVESTGPFHQQQSGNSYKMQNENTVQSQVIIYMGYHILFLPVM
jgi:hypothetical protein